MGVKERVGHWDDEGRIIVFSRPYGVFAVGPRIRGVHTVGPFDVVPAFGGLVESFCDSHEYAPVAVQENGEKVSHIAWVYQDDSAGASACTI
jgi:hypothetical protein